MQTGGQTDMTKLIVAFCNYKKAHNKENYTDIDKIRVFYFDPSWCHWNFSLT